MVLPTKLVKPSDIVLDILRRAEITDQGGAIVLRLTGQLDRKLYEDVNTVLVEFGGKWNRKANGHLFPTHSDPRERLAALDEDGEIRLGKLDFFPTPRAVADQLASLLPRLDVQYLEPSAGDGALCRAMERIGVSPAQIVVCEIDDQKRVFLSGAGYTVVGSDFLSIRSPQFRCIAMNPPFSGQRDIEHVLHAFNNCLVPGGRIVAIMAESVFFRQDAKSTAFRALLDACGFSEELDDGAFKESGTMAKTRIVVLDKPI